MEKRKRGLSLSRLRRRPKAEQPTRKVIGVPLDESCRLDPSFDGVPLPAFFRKCIDYVEEHGLSLEGIYRVSSPISRLDELESLANEGKDFSFSDSYEAACLAKRFLRGLPSPLLPSSLSSLANSCTCCVGGPCGCGVAPLVRKALGHLPPSHTFLVAYTFLHARNVIDMEPVNKMGVVALGMLLQQILRLDKNAVLLFLFNCSPPNEIFGEIKLKRLRAVRSLEEVENNEHISEGEIDEQMAVHEHYAAYLHAQIISLRGEDKDTSGLEQSIWNAQAVITALHRKKKTASQPAKEKLSSERLLREKQLMAVGSRIREEMRNEEQRILLLLWRISRQAKGRTDEDEGGDGDRDRDRDRDRDGDGDEGGHYTHYLEKERNVDMKKEMERRSALVEDIAALNTECAQLRCNINIRQSPT